MEPLLRELDHIEKFQDRQIAYEALLIEKLQALKQRQEHDEFKECTFKPEIAANKGKRETHPKFVKSRQSSEIYEHTLEIPTINAKSRQLAINNESFSQHSNVHDRLYNLVFAKQLDFNNVVSS